MKMTQAQPEVDETRCTRCGLCVEACNCEAVKVGDHGPVFTCPEVASRAEPGTEAECSCLCEEVCPTGAISWPFEIVLETDASGRGCAAEQSGTDPGTDPASTSAQTAG